MKQCNVWSKAFHLRLEEVLDDFYNQQKTLHFRFKNSTLRFLVRLPDQLCCRFSLKPLYNAVAEMEFRIFHSIFCDMFRIQKLAFAFDEYVEIVFEKYVMNIIKIRMVN